VCWIGFIFWCVFTGLCFSKGGGTHGWNLTKPETVPILYVRPSISTIAIPILTIMQWFNLCAITYGIVMCLCKLTLLAMYRALFVTQRQSILNIILHVLGACLIVFYLGQTIVKFVECRPREKIWNKSISGHCDVTTSAILNSSGLFNMLTDILIVLIPIKCVWDLKMRRAERLRVVLVFAVGTM
jgi:hypothetical protein